MQTSHVVKSPLQEFYKLKTLSPPRFLSLRLVLLELKGSVQMKVEHKHKVYLEVEELG